MMYLEKIEQMMDSEEFVQKLNLTACVEEMQELFAQHGVDITMDELNRMIASVSVGANGELNEDALENVAGGGKAWDWIKKQLNNWFKRRSKKNAEDINDILAGLNR